MARPNKAAKKEERPTPGADHIAWMLRTRIPTYEGGQKALAMDIGASESQLSLWKSGERGKNLSPEHLIRIAAALRVSTDQLLGVAPLPPIDALILDARSAEIRAVAEDLRRVAERLLAAVAL